MVRPVRKSADGCSVKCRIDGSTAYFRRLPVRCAAQPKAGDVRFDLFAEAEGSAQHIFRPGGGDEALAEHEAALICGE